MLPSITKDKQIKKLITHLSIENLSHNHRHIHTVWILLLPDLDVVGVRVFSMFFNPIPFINVPNIS